MSRARHRKKCPDNTKPVEHCEPLQPKEEDDICCEEKPDKSNEKENSKNERQTKSVDTKIGNKKGKGI